MIQKTKLILIALLLVLQIPIAIFRFTTHRNLDSNGNFRWIILTNSSGVFTFGSTCGYVDHNTFGSREAAESAMLQISNSLWRLDHQMEGWKESK